MITRFINFIKWLNVATNPCKQDPTKKCTIKSGDSGSLYRCCEVQRKNDEIHEWFNENKDVNGHVRVDEVKILNPPAKDSK